MLACESAQSRRNTNRAWEGGQRGSGAVPDKTLVLLLVDRTRRVCNAFAVGEGEGVRQQSELEGRELGNTLLVVRRGLVGGEGGLSVGRGRVRGLGFLLLGRGRRREGDGRVHGAEQAILGQGATATARGVEHDEACGSELGVGGGDVEEAGVDDFAARSSTA